MGLYIKGAKMPKNCWTCPCHNKEYLICQVTDSCCEYEKPNNCPLVELPSKHGRLVDADALARKLKNENEEELKQLPHGSIERLVAGMLQAVLIDALSEENAPTVLEAEGEEYDA